MIKYNRVAHRAEWPKLLETIPRPARGTLAFESDRAATSSEGSRHETGQLNRFSQQKKRLPPRAQVPRKFHKSPSHNFRGVSYVAKDRKWQSRITYNGSTRWLGVFTTKEAAARKYDQFARKLGRTLNFPPEKNGTQETVWSWSRDDSVGIVSFHDATVYVGTKVVKTTDLGCALVFDWCEKGRLKQPAPKPAFRERSAGWFSQLSLSATIPQQPALPSVLPCGHQ